MDLASLEQFLLLYIAVVFWHWRSQYELEIGCSIAKRHRRIAFQIDNTLTRFSTGKINVFWILIYKPFNNIYKPEILNQHVIDLAIINGTNNEIIGGSYTTSMDTEAWGPIKLISLFSRSSTIMWDQDWRSIQVETLSHALEPIVYSLHSVT